MKSVDKIKQEENHYKDFAITSVCWADLESAGFDAKNVDDDTMKELASKMAIGGVIKKIDDKGVAEVEITRVERIHISKLTLDDPIP